MNACAIAYIAHPEEHEVEIIGLTIEGREQDMAMVPDYLLEAAEAWAKAVEHSKEDERDD